MDQVEGASVRADGFFGASGVDEGPVDSGPPLVAALSRLDGAVMGLGEALDIAESTLGKVMAPRVPVDGVPGEALASPARSEVTEHLEALADRVERHTRALRGFLSRVEL